VDESERKSERRLKVEDRDEKYFPVHQGPHQEKIMVIVGDRGAEGSKMQKGMQWCAARPFQSS